VYSLGNLTNGMGRAIGNGMAGIAFRALQVPLPPPLNYAVGLAAFQLFFVPTGLMYLRASRSSPADIAAVHELLEARAERSEAATTPPTP
jgi:hypothetical protein